MPESRSSQPPFTIRPAKPDDVRELLGMIRELAEFEQLEHLLKASESDLHAALFAKQGGPEALVAQRNFADDGGADQLIGYAIYFENFSSFLCRRGIYLEDIYVRPTFRRQGVGKAFLKGLADVAIERSSGRMEWVVLDWNQNAINAYRAIGGEVLPDWRVVRLGEEAIRNLADGSLNHRQE